MMLRPMCAVGWMSQPSSRRATQCFGPLGQHDQG